LSEEEIFARLDAVLKKTDELKASHQVIGKKNSGGAPTPQDTEKATPAASATSLDPWFHTINEFLKTNSDAPTATPTSQKSTLATGATSLNPWYDTINEYLKTHSEALTATCPA
jgi:hypothetical protein